MSDDWSELHQFRDMPEIDFDRLHQYRIGSNICVMVWEDREYGLIAWKQTNHFGRHTDLSFGNPQWETLAQAFGWSGHYVQRSADLAGALDDALATPGPSLVVIPVDYRENELLTKKLGEITCTI